jgi:hypothetical protein
MDNALYIDGLNDDEQPGMNVRRIPGLDHRASDEEMIEYYSNLIEKHGGRMTGHWEFGMCLAFPDGTIRENTSISQKRYFKSEICEIRSPGYPLESIQYDPELNKYIVEMSKEEVDQFWQISIGDKIRELFAGLEEIKVEQNSEFRAK